MDLDIYVWHSVAHFLGNTCLHGSLNLPGLKNRGKPKPAVTLGKNSRAFLGATASFPTDHFCGWGGPKTPCGSHKIESLYGVVTTSIWQ